MSAWHKKMQDLPSCANKQSGWSNDLSKSAMPGRRMLGLLSDNGNVWTLPFAELRQQVAMKLAFHRRVFPRVDALGVRGYIQPRNALGRWASHAAIIRPKW